MELDKETYCLDCGTETFGKARCPTCWVSFKTDERFKLLESRIEALEKEQSIQQSEIGVLQNK
jgi:hypothetical protein